MDLFHTRTLWLLLLGASTITSILMLIFTIRKEDVDRALISVATTVMLSLLLVLAMSGTSEVPTF